MKLFNYTVVANRKLIGDMMNFKNMQGMINWFNFNHNDIYYDCNGNAHYIREINHKHKYVRFDV